MVKAAEALSARARARQAKAELDVQRAEQDRLIVDTATEFYEAEEALVAAQAAAAAAEQARSTAVARLVELGQTDTQIATLCGIAAKDVKELRRRAAAAKQSPKTKAPEAASAPPAPAVPAGQDATGQTVAA